MGAQGIRARLANSPILDGAVDRLDLLCHDLRFDRVLEGRGEAQQGQRSKYREVHLAVGSTVVSESIRHTMSYRFEGGNIMRGRRNLAGANRAD